MERIGIWRMRVTEEGRPRKGGVISLANTRSSTVTGVLPSFTNDLMHIMVQDKTTGQLSYLIFDLAFGRVSRATPISRTFVTPVMSLLAHKRDEV